MTTLTDAENRLTELIKEAHRKMSSSDFEEWLDKICIRVGDSSSHEKLYIEETLREISEKMQSNPC